MPRRKKQVTNKGYQGYIKAFEAKKKTLERRGSKMYDEIPLTRAQWAEQYKMEKNKLAGLVEAGERKQIGNVNQYIVSSQAYEISLKQAKAIMSSDILTGRGEEKGIFPKGYKRHKLKWLDIREGKVDFAAIAEEYQYVKDHLQDLQDLQDLAGITNYKGKAFVNTKGGTTIETLADARHYISWYFFGSD